MFSQANEESEIPTFNPSVSSIMLHPGQVELNLFSSFFFNGDTLKYTQAIRRDSENFVLYNVASNNSYFANTLQTSLGVAKKITIGLDFTYINQDLNYKIDSTSVNQTNNLTRIAPRIRWAVYETSKSNLVVQHYLSMPIFGSKSKTDSIPNIFNDYIFGNQIISTIRLREFILMNQLSIIFYNKYPIDQRRPFVIPYTFYASYLLSTETMLFGLAQFTADFGNYAYAENPKKYYFKAYSFSLGVGIQQRIAKNLNINLYYNHAVAKDKYLGYHSINLGIRYATL